jgi:hypothetical protein
MRRDRLSSLFSLLVVCGFCLYAGGNARAQRVDGDINVASSKNGGRVTASSTFNTNYPASATIDDETLGVGWGKGTGGWNDATEGGMVSSTYPYGPGYPDTLTIEFKGVRYLSEVDVFTLQDNFTFPRDPTNLTFSTYGIVDFDVHYQAPDNTWQIIQQVRGNYQVRRSLPLTTQVAAKAVRITVFRGASPSPSNYSRIVEVQAWARPVTMTIATTLPGSPNLNFAFPSNGGYSVSLNPPYLQAYASNNFHANRWSTARDTVWNFYYRNRLEGGACSFKLDPSQWDQKCSTDAIGYFRKRVSCTGTPGEICGDSPIWNVWGGSSGGNNIWGQVDRYPSHDAVYAPVWPGTDTWGVPNFKSIIDFKKINAAIPNPPPTGIEWRCNPYNPRNLATGGANGKVVQVNYPNGTSRWFMAFNSQVSAHTTTGLIGSDNWRILWATSSDGANWTISPQILFRSTIESQECGYGFLVTDMFVDDGYFYMVFTEVRSNYTHLVRSRIDLQNPSNALGFTQWSVAANPVINGQYTWKDIPTGQQLDFTATGYDAYQALNTIFLGQKFMVKQASIARVFNSSTPYSRSRYVAITIDRDTDSTPIFVQLWSTDDLSKPFNYESNVAGTTPGVFGYEFGFNHFANNAPESPKILGTTGLHFWFTTIEQTFGPGTPVMNAYLITRNTATISGF